LNLLFQFSCCQPLSVFIPIKLLKHISHSVATIATHRALVLH
jgi:hypothetical protein